MTNEKRFIWLSMGTIAGFLMSSLVTMAYHAITWVPMLVEIASVTWNDTHFT